MTSPRSLSRAWLSLPHAVARGPWSHLQLCPGCHHPSPASSSSPSFREAGISYTSKLYRVDFSRLVSCSFQGRELKPFSALPPDSLYHFSGLPDQL